MSWQSYIKQFSDYLKLERSLSTNSIEAYVRDVEKLDQYVSLHHGRVVGMKFVWSQRLR